MKLLNMLMQDFGFSKIEIHTFFSGHRGYHVHVDSESVRTLDANARKEIVDYISGLGIDVAFHARSRTGWSSRIAKGVHDFILSANDEELARMGLNKNVVKTVLKNREAILRNLNSSGILSAVKGVGPETWRKIVEFCAQNQSAKIDTVVTTDIHRLIRLADSLHGKTGFKKVGFPISGIEDFDPFKSAVAFKKGTALVFVSDAPEFRLGDENFGPYKKQKIELPAAAALLLICRDRAEVVE
jgi:DNA primase small subunit